MWRISYPYILIFHPTKTETSVMAALIYVLHCFKMRHFLSKYLFTLHIANDSRCWESNIQTSNQTLLNIHTTHQFVHVIVFGGLFNFLLVQNCKNLLKPQKLFISSHPLCFIAIPPIFPVFFKVKKTSNCPFFTSLRAH